MSGPATKIPSVRIRRLLLQFVCVVSALIGLTLFSGSMSTVHAHHEPTAFDLTRVIQIRGEILRLRWVSPHATVRVSGSAPDGSAAVWTVEMAAPDELVQQGWQQDLLRVGEQVVIYANPLAEEVLLSDGSHGAAFVGAQLSDGTLLGRTDGQPLISVPAPAQGELLQ